MAITASFGTSMILQAHGAHVIYQLQHMLQLQLTDACKYDVNYLNSTATSYMEDYVSPQIKTVNGDHGPLPSFELPTMATKY